ncbi:RtcB family protein [Plantactinospora sp. S1510]|uniref:tRNA-splicing ligase RtcB n=1 Tax=Plantactinospora alkalitolerans TaxID=2789879 RepID=A0ABS0GW50_9ACTN|nr:RtcB family protein [Plantactinospora alkalitolerans]MBF9130304.1 RtcB family protein [Plantactinospora alkalitolerans]
MTLHQHYLPAARRLLDAAGLRRSLDEVCRLPGIEKVDVFPDVTVKDWGFPSGLAIRSRGYLYPLAVPDPGSGYHVSALPVRRDQLGPDEVRALYDAVASSVNHRDLRHEYPEVDLDRVLADGLNYAAELHADLGGPAAEPADRGWHRAGVVARFDDDLKATLRRSLGGADGHYVAVQWIQQLLDPGTAHRHGLRTGQLVVIIHIGARPMREYIYRRYGIPAAEHSIHDGSALPEQLRTGIFAVRSDSPYGEAYLDCAAASANFGYFNRHLVRLNVLAALAPRWGDLTGQAPLLQHRHHTELSIAADQIVTARRGVQRLDADAGGEWLPDRREPLSYVAGGEFGSSYLVAAANPDRYANLCGHGIPEWQPVGRFRDQIDDCLPHARAAVRNSAFDLQTFVRDLANLEETTAHVRDIGMARPVARLYPLVNFRSPI